MRFLDLFCTAQKDFKTVIINVIVFLVMCLQAAKIVLLEKKNIQYMVNGKYECQPGLLIRGGGGGGSLGGGVLRIIQR